MKLPDGYYSTKHGSTLHLSRNGGRASVCFDWVEEPNACCECTVEPYPDDNRLTWGCDECDGGSAELFPNTKDDL